MRTPELRRIPAWLARPVVPAAENRSIILPAIENFTRILENSGLTNVDQNERKNASQRIRDMATTPMDVAYVTMCLDFIQGGVAFLAPHALREKTDSISLTTRESDRPDDTNDRALDTARELLSVSLPGLFFDLDETTKRLNDEDLESSRIVVAKFYNLLANLVDSQYDDIARFGEFLSTSLNSEGAKSLDHGRRVIAYGIFAIIRPFAKEQFTSIVRLLPATVAILAVLRTQFAFETPIRNFLAIDFSTTLR